MTIVLTDFATAKQKRRANQPAVFVRLQQSALRRHVTRAEHAPPESRELLLFRGLLFRLLRLLSLLGLLSHD